MRPVPLCIFSIAAILLYSCNNAQPERKSLPETDTITSAETAEHSDNTRYIDTLVVDRIAAVFYQPDSDQIAKAIEVDGEDDFYTAEDDMLFYLAGARKFLDSNKLVIIDTDICRYIKFVYTDNTFTLIKRDTLKEMSGIIFFDRVQKPFLPEFLDIAPDFRKYFKK